jgi:hypothetical protein
VEDDLILRAELRDDVSGPARRVALHIKGIAEAAQQAERASNRATSASGRLRGGISGLVGVTGRAASGIGSLAGGIGGMAAAAGRATRTVGVGFVAALTAASVATFKLASDAVEVQQAFDVTFGQSRASMQAFVDDLHDRFGIATADLIKMTSVFGVFGDAAGIPAEGLEDFSKGLTQVTLDIASFYNARPEDVAVALRSGLTGEIEPIRQFGFFINMEMVKAKGAAMGFTGELSEQEKILARNQLILEQYRAAPAMGDLERTAMSAANMVRNLGGRLKDLGTIAGRVLVPAFEVVAPLMVDTLVRATTWLNANLPRLQGNLRRIAEQLVAVGRARTLPGGIVTFFGGSNAPDVVHRIARAVRDVQSEIRGVLRTVEGHQAGGAFIALFGADWAPLVQQVIGAARDIRSGVAAVFTEAGDLGESAFGGLKTWWGANRQTVITEAAGLIEEVRGGIKDRLGAIVDITKMLGEGDYRGAGERIGQMIREGLENMGDIAGIVGGWFAKIDWVGLGMEVGKAAVPLLVGIAVGLLNFDPVDLLRELGDHWFEALMAVLSLALAPTKFIGPLGRILGKIPFVGTFLQKLVTWVNELGGPIRRFVGQLWETFSSAFGGSLDNLGPGVFARLRGFLANIPAALSSLADDVGLRAMYIVERIGGALGAGWNALRTAARTMIDGALSGIREMFGDFANLGGGIARSIWNGISRLGSWLAGKLGGWIRGALGGLGEAGSRVADFFLPGRLYGGPVAAGQLYVVGERGPELFVGATGTHLVGASGPELFTAPSSGYIEPTDRTAALLAPAAAGHTEVSEQHTYNITINGAQDPGAVRREVEAFLRAHERDRAERRTRWQR